MRSDFPCVDLASLEDLEEAMADGAGAVVLDFWSSDHAPRRGSAADFLAVASQFADDPVRFCRVQVDLHPDLAAPFQIRSLPTVFFAIDGRVLEAAVGRVDRRSLVKQVDWLLRQQRGDGFFSRLFGFGT